MREVPLYLIGLGAILLVAACGGSNLTYVKRPMPSVISGATRVTVGELTYDGLNIGDYSYEAYIEQKRAKAELAGKDSDSAQQWEQLRQKWKSDFANILSTNLAAEGMAANTGTARDGLVIAGNVEFIEPGFYAFVAVRPAMTRIRFRIYDTKAPGISLYEFVGTEIAGGVTLDQRVSSTLNRLAASVARFIAGETTGH